MSVFSFSKTIVTSLTFYLLVCVFMCASACVHASVRVHTGWKAEDYLQKSLLSLHHMGPVRFDIATLPDELSRWPVNFLSPMHLDVCVLHKHVYIHTHLCICIYLHKWK